MTVPPPSTITNPPILLGHSGDTRQSKSPHQLRIG
jgi:hypothetical protein